MAQSIQSPNNLPGKLPNLSINRSMLFGAILLTALMAFEFFNYGTTDYALTDLLGDLTFLGIRWATILAIAFCGIDFAGIARLFAPELANNRNENWFLFSAWLLAATMNASLTWWGVSLAILNHQNQGGVVIAHDTMIRVAPVFVAILVWLIRVLVIGTFSMNGDQLFNSRPASQAHNGQTYRPVQAAYRPMSARPTAAAKPAPTQAVSARPKTPTPLPPAGQPISHVYANTPRRYTPPPEPEYGDEDEEEMALSIPQPVYAKTPLAARSNRDSSGNSSGKRFK